MTRASATSQPRPDRQSPFLRNGINRGDDLFKVYTTDLPSEGSTRDYLVEGLVERDNTGLFIGYPEAAKSTYLVHFGGCVVGGQSFFGHAIAGGPYSALVFSPERPKEMRRRLRAFEQLNERDIPDLGLVGDSLDFVHGDRDVNRVIATALDHEQRCGRKLAFVAFDTVFDLLAGGDENHPRDMGSVSRNLQRIRRELDAAVIAVCHPSMDRPHEPRGHKSLLAKADFTVVITTDKKSGGARHWRVQKANSLEVKPRGHFICQGVLVDTDTAPAVVAGGASAPSGSRDDMVRQLVQQAGGQIVVSALSKGAQTLPSFHGCDDDARRVAVDRLIKGWVADGRAQIIGHGKTRQVRLTS